MPQNIFINNVELARANLIFDRYYDFKLSKGPVVGLFSDFKKNASFDFNGLNQVPEWIISNDEWDGARNDGITLENIGLTGPDNGLIDFHGKTLTEEELLDVFKNTKITIPEGMKKFFLKRVSSNTGLSEYPLSATKDGIAFKGGFYQGFFKIEGTCYQVLPTAIEDALSIDVRLRPRKDYGDLSENDFFFIGTRAENKFAPFYNKKYTKTEDSSYFIEDFVSEHPEDYLEENPYEIQEKDISVEEITTSEGLGIIEGDKEVIDTDNKFIFFNNTENGFTTETWNKDNKVSIITEKAKNDVNLFPIMNYTENGYTTDTLDRLKEEESSSEGEKYMPEKDIRNNAMSFFITGDGRIGYKYAVLDCESEDGFTGIETEESDENLVKEGQWSDIKVIINLVRPGTMKLYFYVNGNLVLISKELQELNLRGLNDSPSKQEAVPYSISIGGGTQGLNNVIYPGGYDVEHKEGILEKHFSTPFYGDISYFSINGKKTEQKDGK